MTSYHKAASQEQLGTAFITARPLLISDLKIRGTLSAT
jgi:hypothetical protein